jgi:hypothetical protein
MPAGASFRWRASQDIVGHPQTDTEAIANMPEPVGSGRPPDSGGTEGDAHRQPVVDDARTTRHVPGPRRAHPAGIGPFRILSLIGEGARGIVYEAEQERPQRRVALKPATPPPRLRAALERLVAFYVATRRSAEAVPWRNRLQGLDAAASAGEKTWRR